MHPDLQPGHMLHNDRYRITKRLDRGGFGVIYLAEDLALRRTVAIKENQDTSTNAQRRFQREAHLLARLDHPRLPSITDHFIEQSDPALVGRQYLVMEFIPGEDLQEIIESKGAQGEKQVIGWIDQVMETLIYMHTWENPETGQIEPMIHRDIKPANIKVTPQGKVFLVDFGLAKHEMDYSGFSSLGLTSGTHGYSPPEQYDEDVRNDERSDIYSLGATLYHLLTGKRPVEAPTRREGHSMLSVRKANAKISKRTARIIERAMALEPDERYSRVRAMQDDLSGKTKTPWQWLSWTIGIVVAVVTMFNGGMKAIAEFSEAQGYLCEMIEVESLERMLGCSLSTGHEIVSAPASTPVLVQPTTTSAPKPTQTSLPPTSTPRLQPSSTYVSPVDGAIYVYIPAGEFIMGSEDGNNDESPQHVVYLDAYWIMRTEVTNAQYGKFIDAGGYTNQSYWEAGGWDRWIKPGYQDDSRYSTLEHPVIGISWYEAQAYASWLSMGTGLDFGLPTEAQWEKAARGTDGNIYPWGRQWSISKANATGIDDGNRYTAPVGSYPTGASPYGAVDMAGNVREWTSDWYATDYYQNSPSRNPQGRLVTMHRVVRGGSWFNVPNLLRSSARYLIEPDLRVDKVGFRLQLSSAPD